MRVDKLEGKDYILASRVMNMAFNADWAEETSLEEATRTLEEELSRGDIVPERIGAFDDNNDLMAQVQFNPFRSFMWGASVPMEGIGGVATLPQFRRRGAIRAIMKEGFRRMNERGTVITILYPFSSKFYRKFGYESFVEMDVAFINTRLIDPVMPPPEGAWRMLQPADEASNIQAQWEADYRALSEEVEAGFQLATHRDDWAWSRIIKSNESRKGKLFSYIFYRHKDREAEEPIVACSLSIGADGHNQQMNVHHAVCKDNEAVLALLAFLHSFSNDQTEAKVNLPTGSSIHRYLKEHAGIGRTERTFHGMIGVVNVQRFLEHYVRFAPEPLPLTVSVFDEFSGWNTGVYSINVDEASVGFTPIQADNKLMYQERATALIADQGLCEPDVFCKPEGLALLLLGLDDGSHLVGSGLIETQGLYGDALSQMQRQSVYLSDYF